MARYLKYIRSIRNFSSNKSLVHPNSASSNTRLQEKIVKEYKTENNITYLEDPDTFGTLAGIKCHNQILEDEGDIKEEKYLQELPLPSQKLTIKQYADVIKQYVSQKRLKEAIDVLEVRMLQVDRVKPENYIYNILIGACAEMGYTKKAFTLYNDMKRRALKPTGDTYTCLFESCINSPWKADGLKNVKHLRELMIEKGIEPNITNFNVMIKAFGRCGDLVTAFKIVDEMILKKIKIRVHTFNHLIHACITDRENGLRHALVVWRKMLTMREKPNIYSFNLMLKCVKECNLGTKDDIQELIGIIQQHIINSAKMKTLLKIESGQKLLADTQQNAIEEVNHDLNVHTKTLDSVNIADNNSVAEIKNNTELVPTSNQEITMQILDVRNRHITEEKGVPNLLSRSLQLDNVYGLQGVHTAQEKFAVIGGQDDFLKEMEQYSVKPDIKIFTQMLPLIDANNESENKLMQTMTSLGITADIDFFNMLIKNRCLRSDYDGAFEVKSIIENEIKKRQKKIHPLNKKQKLCFNVMTYGVLAMACNTKEKAEQLLNEMTEKQLKVNIEILGSMFRQGAVNMDFEYILYIMQRVKEENLKINNIFIKHLKLFSNICENKIKKDTSINDPVFTSAYNKFKQKYRKWLKDVNPEGTSDMEHPWQQFKENYPDTLQRSSLKIDEPRKFYKRSRKYTKYIAKL